MSLRREGAGSPGGPGPTWSGLKVPARSNSGTTG